VLGDSGAAPRRLLVLGAFEPSELFRFRVAGGKPPGFLFLKRNAICESKRHDQLMLVNAKLS